MNFLIVPKPVFTSEMTVEGYFIVSQYGNAILESTKSNPLDRAMDSSFIDFVSDVGLEALTQNKTIFLPVTQILLLTDLERNIKEDISKIVFILDENIQSDEMTLERITRFSKMGFRFAFRFLGDLEAIRPFMPYINFVFLQVDVQQLVPQARLLQKAFPHATLVAADIEEKPVFDQIKHSNIELFDGPFYKVHISSGTPQNALAPLKVNYIQLLNVVNQDDFDFKTFTRTVRQDMALAIQFMKLVNTASHSRTEVKNLNQAAAMLGQREIKKWVSAAVSSALCADSPSEISRVSLIRAKFCENLSRHFEMAIAQENLFLLGLFSVLDVVLEMSMEKALDMIFVPGPIYEALVNHTGNYYDILNFVQEYEQGNWKEISRIALMRNITISQIHTAYKEALLWYSGLINMEIGQEAL